MLSMWEANKHYPTFIVISDISTILKIVSRKPVFIIEISSKISILSGISCQQKHGDLPIVV